MTLSNQDVASSEANIPVTEYHLMLSSRHLTLASPVCRKMFSQQWGEALQRDGEGRIVWRPEGELLYLDAFVIVMNVIHGRNREVPRDVNLELLAKIAVVTDYLQCHESMGVISPIWIDGLRVSLSQTYSRELILWIMISSIFGDQDAFRQATRTAILMGSEMVPSDGLPIHEKIIGKTSDSW